MRRHRSRGVPSREGERPNPAVCLRTLQFLWVVDSRCCCGCPTPAEKEAVSSELSESSDDDDETRPLLTSMAVHTLEVSCIRALTILFIVGLDWEVETSSDTKMK